MARPCSRPLLAVKRAEVPTQAPARVNPAPRGTFCTGRSYDASRAGKSVEAESKSAGARRLGGRARMESGRLMGAVSPFGATRWFWNWTAVTAAQHCECT